MIPMELTFPVEQRDFEIPALRCPDCYNTAKLRRVPDGTKYFYQVRCINDRCLRETNWMPSSQDALRVWTLAAKLSQ